MPTINLKNIEIEYSNKDEEYINLIVKSLTDFMSTALEFFKLKEITSPINIKLWASREEYAEFMFDKTKQKLPTWGVASAGKIDGVYYIHSLCLDEVHRSQGHEKEALETFIKTFNHEFVHAAHIEFAGFMGEEWFREGLACALSKQNYKFKIQGTKEEIKEGKAKYSDYYTIARFLLEKREHDYILDLAKNPELQKYEFDKIYNEAINFVENYDTLSQNKE